MRTGQAVEAVPVTVHATALTGRPLTEELAKAATAELGEFGLLDGLPATFFRDPPDRDLLWLVLVDGLDEITNSQARKRVLRALAAVHADDHGAQYRFVVTTRPLPDEELADLGENVPRYELLPFIPNDVLRSADRISVRRRIQFPEPGRLRLPVRFQVSGS